MITPLPEHPNEYLIHRDFLPDGAYEKLRSIIKDVYNVGYTTSCSPWRYSIGVMVNNKIQFWIYPESIFTFDHYEHIFMYNPRYLK